MAYKYLDDTGVLELWKKVKARSIPVKSLSQNDYNGFSEEEKQKDVLYVLGPSNSNLFIDLYGIDMGDKESVDVDFDLPGSIIGFTVTKESTIDFIVEKLRKSIFGSFGYTFEYDSGKREILCWDSDKNPLTLKVSIDDVPIVKPEVSASLRYKGFEIFGAGGGGDIAPPVDISGKQDKLTGQPGQLIGIGNDGTAKATVYPCNRNMLINGYFGNPVNRNGQTEYTAVGYAIDRWATTGNQIKVNVMDGYVRITKVTALYNPGFIQTFENNDLEGQTVTFSVMYRTNSPNVKLYGSGHAMSFLPISTNDDWSIHSITFTVKSENFGTFTNSMFGLLQFTADMEQNAYADIKAAKVELGDQQTLAHQENGNWVLNEIPNYAEQYAICEQYSPTTGEFVGSQHSNPNLLNNWYFADPINQRMKTEYTGPYTIDRWLVIRGKIQLSNNDIIFVKTNEDADAWFGQRIENDLGGQMVTFSALVDNELHVLTCVFPIFGSAAIESPKKNNVYIKLENNSIHILASIWNTALNVEKRIQAAKLELGPVQTLAHKEGDEWVLNDPLPNYQQELAKCQRYQLVIGNENAFSSFGIGQARSTTRTSLLVPIPTTMRAIPTITVEGNVMLRHGDTIINPTKFTIDAVGTHALLTFVDASNSALEIGAVYEAILRAGTKVIFDANL